MSESSTNTTTMTTQIALCRLCCSKMYSGESMLLVDTEKIKAWFRCFHSIELEVLAGFSNDFCHFCLYKVDLFLHSVWRNEKVFNGEEARLARRTCSDTGTSGWAFCRACLGTVRSPESAFTIEKYGLEQLNTLIKILGYKIHFTSKFPSYICSLCVNGLHKFVNRFYFNKENLTPDLLVFKHQLQLVPVPKLEKFVTNDNLPDINNPKTSIVEVLFGYLSLESMKSWLSSSQAGAARQLEQSALPPTAIDSPPSTTLPFPKPQPDHKILPQDNIQLQLKQLQVNQALITARSMLSGMQAHRFTQNPVSPLAVQMAISQQMGPFLTPFNMPFNPAFLPPFNQVPLPPPSFPSLPVDSMANLFVQRMNTENFARHESSPPAKRRRNRKSDSPMPAQRDHSPVTQKGFSRPDQFFQEGTRRGHIAFSSSPVQTASTGPNYSNPFPYLSFQTPQQPQQLVPALHPHEIVAASPPSINQVSSKQQDQKVSPSEVSPLPAFDNAFSNGARVIVSPGAHYHTLPKTLQVPTCTSNQKILPSPEEPNQCAQSEVGNSSTMTASPLKDPEQQLRVPPIRIRLSPGATEKGGSPTRGFLPEVIQMNNLQPKGGSDQMKITVYKAEEESLNDEYSLKSLLEQSPIAMGPVLRYDDSGNFRELHSKSETPVI